VRRPWTAEEEVARAPGIQRPGPRQGRGALHLRLRRREPSAVADGVPGTGRGPGPEPQLVRRRRAHPEGPRAGEGPRGPRGPRSGTAAVLTIRVYVVPARNVNSRRATAMQRALAEYLHHLGVEKNASPHTVKSYRKDLTQAVEFFRGRFDGQTPGPERITTRLLRAYLAWLNEQGYARTTVARRLAAVRSWFRFLCRQGGLKTNPAVGLRGPRLDKTLPHFLQREEMQRLLSAPGGETPLGLRDRAILETLYSAGLRVGELTGLDVTDLDLDGGIATVRGKGRRERLA